MTATFYSMTSPKASVGKSMSQKQESTCQVFGEVSITDPSLIVKVSDEVLASNYVYIAEFGRYYFIKNITIIEGNRAKVDCHVDVLETYWGTIKTTKQHVIRNQYKYNLYMRDPALTITTRPKRQVISMTKTAEYPFIQTPSNDGHNFVLNAI